MTSSELPLESLCEQAVEAARVAGQLIQSTDRTRLQRKSKNAGTTAASQLVTELDLRSEKMIREVLQPSCEQWDIGFVGEESAQGVARDTHERLLKPCYWCVDPLDGTLPFMEDRPGYAVSIALVQRSGVPLIGVVYDPVNATTLHAIRGQGAYQDDSPLVRMPEAPSVLTVFADASLEHHEDYSRLRRILEDCAAESALDKVKLVYGSGAVINAWRVLQTPASCYIKLPRQGEGGGSIWDFAATACIVEEAGGAVSNVSGNALDLNRSDSSFMNHEGVLYASNKRIALYLIQRLSSVAG